MGIPDWRHIENGNRIPTFAYSDQPYIIKADDGAWVCATTTGIGVEGASGECVVISRSTDRGRNWSMPMKLDSDYTDYAYAVMLKSPDGRLFCFYNHNTDCVDRGDLFGKRCDMGGHFVYKYSFDNGMTWSATRYEIPVREFEIDRRNPLMIKDKPHRFFWNVGKPFLDEGNVYLPLIKFDFHKISIIKSSEGVLLKSDNLISERDHFKIHWETLPDGDIGIRAPSGGGPAAEEQSFSVLSDGSFFCIFRTVDGRAAFTYSRDKGHTWEPSQYMPLKNPRAASFVWKCSNGKYLCWFHNNGLKGYTDRNPVWLACGEETDGPGGVELKWGQPELLLYDDSEYSLISYPDLIEEDGEIYITETQKDIARLHHIPRLFLEKLFEQPLSTVDYNDSVVLDTGPGLTELPGFAKFSDKDFTDTHFAKKDLRTGLTLEFLCDGSDSVVFNNMTPGGKGICLDSCDGIIRIRLSDGRTTHIWDSAGFSLVKSKLNHVAVIIDGGPKVLSMVMNGKFCDGGETREFGWSRLSSSLIDLNGLPEITVPDSVSRLRIHCRALMTSEVISNGRNLLDS